jgi:hypothetical protein
MFSLEWMAFRELMQTNSMQQNNHAIGQYTVLAWMLRSMTIEL